MTYQRCTLFYQLIEQGLLLGDESIDLHSFEIEKACNRLLLFQWWFYSRNSNQITGVDSRVAHTYGVRNYLTNKSIGLEKITCESGMKILLWTDNYKAS
ncbi:hypothetical protein WI61_14875 [Burkholderia cepacia]|nr:hypothetical protein WI48_31265 [Burkholderia cepacia]KVA70913.1 hypothetical protein WI49_35035 [Burkholderia cepacia]KVA82861.1 hypothetical protein WI50_21610 [Burkholderia cepacia]KVA93693.1 hypothetical protein WI52_03730 [Burkholderia cepacia]KVA95079.1 hypothetical protein WI51_03360 [Burkholderia cepacia]